MTRSMFSLTFELNKRNASTNTFHEDYISLTYLHHDPFLTFLRQNSTCSLSSSGVPVTFLLHTGQVVSSCFFFLPRLRATSMRRQLLQCYKTSLYYIKQLLICKLSISQEFQELNKSVMFEYENEVMLI